MSKTKNTSKKISNQFVLRISNKLLLERILLIKAKLKQQGKINKKKISLNVFLQKMITIGLDIEEKNQFLYDYEDEFLDKIGDKFDYSLQKAFKLLQTLDINILDHHEMQTNSKQEKINFLNAKINHNE